MRDSKITTVLFRNELNTYIVIECMIYKVLLVEY